MGADPINLSTEFITVLGDYADANVDEISTLVARFFHLFATECPFLESYEIDNFILRNSTVLGSW